MHFSKKFSSLLLLFNNLSRFIYLFILICWLKTSTTTIVERRKTIYDSNDIDYYDDVNSHDIRNDTFIELRAYPICSDHSCEACLSIPEFNVSD